jgi:alpha-1,3-rhamnosyl/mannosyltransferase
MRVVLNGLAALKPKTGVGQYIAHLYRELVHQLGPDPVGLFPGNRIRTWVRPNPGRGTSNAPTGQIHARMGTIAKTAAKAAASIHFAAYSRAFRFDLYHEPNFLPFRSHLPTIVTAHDLSVMRFPEWHPADRVAAHQKAFVAGLERAVHVIVGSDTVRQELIHFLGIPANKVTRVYYGVSAAFRPWAQVECAPVLARLGLPKQFFLCVGTIEPRKNLLTALRAFVELPMPIRSACPLVLAGPWGWKSAETRDYFESTARPAGAIHLGYVADDDLPALYSAAAALLFPTRYEGFGLPPVETLACGGRVIASDLPVVREAVGRHATFLNPDDVPAWQDAMAGTVEMPPGLDASAIHHARQFTWEQTARETVAVYRAILGLADPAPLAARVAA